MLSLLHQLSAHCLDQEQQDVLSPGTMNTTSRDGTDKISTSKPFTEKYRRFTEHFAQLGTTHVFVCVRKRGLVAGGKQLLFGKVWGRARRVGLAHHSSW